MHRAMALDIKICGLKTPDALDAALAGGASHVGFIFFGKSPRNVTPQTAGELREAARGKASAVAVTVDNPHADLGVSVEVEVRACLGDGPCTPLPVTEDGGVWRASLAARADARCDDLSVRDRDLFEIEEDSGGEAG